LVHAALPELDETAAIMMAGGEEIATPPAIVNRDTMTTPSGTRARQAARSPVAPLPTVRTPMARVPVMLHRSALRPPSHPKNAKLRPS
jgi:hypothetical protein